MGIVIEVSVETCSRQLAAFDDLTSKMTRIAAELKRPASSSKWRAVRDERDEVLAYFRKNQKQLMERVYPSLKHTGEQKLRLVINLANSAN